MATRGRKAPKRSTPGILRKSNHTGMVTPQMLWGFTSSLLLPRYDNPQPIPDFHMSMWERVCSTYPYVSIAAPRGHAKSTSITFAYLLAILLFRARKFCLLVAQTERQAAQFLGDIAIELKENEELIDIFHVGEFVKDTETDIIVSFKDGNEFRIMAKGSGQSLRGTKWRNSRPDIILGDDLENDEIVLNEDRRAKFKSWVYNALLPAGSDDCWYRFAGTILHLDSFLNSITPDETDKDAVVTPLCVWRNEGPNSVWRSALFRAHPDFDDFSEILWPEKFPEHRLRMIRQSYIEQGFPEGYAQEYLNTPIDPQNAFFRKEDFLTLPREEMDPERQKMKTIYVGADLAISKKARRAKTNIVVAGYTEEEYLDVYDVWKGRWDSLEIIDNLFAIVERYKPELVIIEEENIARAIGPFLYMEMGKAGRPFIPIKTVVPHTDKEMRARPLQAMVRAGRVRFNKDSEWWSEAQQDLMAFPNGPRLKDFVDALSLIALHINDMSTPLTREELDEMKWEEEYQNSFVSEEYRDAITGY